MRRPGLIALALGVSVLAGACSSSSPSSSPSSSSSSGSSGGGGGGGTATGKKGAVAPAVLNMAFNADMQVPDPDIFYEVEGNAVMTSVYEGLIRYAPNSTSFEPALAESYTTSTDGLAYTFKLRSGVMFHDGTTMTSTDAKASFARRTALGSVSAPGYMLADVVGYDTPDPLTFVIHLKGARFRLSRLPGIPVRPEGIEFDGIVGARRLRYGPDLVEDPRRGYRPVHDE